MNKEWLVEFYDGEEWAPFNRFFTEKDAKQAANYLYDIGYKRVRYRRVKIGWAL